VHEKESKKEVKGKKTRENYEKVIINVVKR